MAMHTSLPIYKISYDLLSLATDLVRNIPRDIKVGLGAKVRDECIEILMLIARANAAVDKAAHIAKLVEHNEVIKVLLRVFKDKGYISVKQHANSIELTEAIGKQANGWKRVTQNRPLHGR